MKFSSAACLIGMAYSQQATQAPTTYDEVSKNIENRVKADLMMQIANYDLTNTLTNQVQD